MNKDKSIYYNLNDILSKNRIYNFLIGNRGGGKSYNAKKWAINSFLRTGKKFLWVRRYTSELNNIEEEFLKDLLFENEYPDHELKIKNHKKETFLYVDGCIAGKFIALSTSMREKSKSYHDYDKIIYDEFIIKLGALRYLKEEPLLFNELYDTVDRQRDVTRCLFIGNSISIVNPYFRYFKIKPNINQRFTMNKNIVIEMYKNKKFIEMKKKTRFGQIIDGTDYGKYNMENEFLDDNYSFVDENRPPKLIYSLTIVYEKQSYGVWLHLGKQKDTLYIDEIVEKDCTRILSVDFKDLDENCKFKNYKGLRLYVDQLKGMFSEGKIYFSTIDVKYKMYEVLKVL